LDSQKERTTGINYTNFLKNLNLNIKSSGIKMKTDKTVRIVVSREATLIDLTHTLFYDDVILVIFQ